MEKWGIFCLCLKLFERSLWKWFPWSWKRNYKGLNHLHSVSVMFGKLGLYPDFNFHFDDYVTLTLPFWWLHCLISFPRFRCLFTNPRLEVYSICTCILIPNIYQIWLHFMSFFTALPLLNNVLFFLQKHHSRVSL